MTREPSPCQLTQIEVFRCLPHGFGIGAATVTKGWLNDAVAFWEQQVG